MMLPTMIMNAAAAAMSRVRRSISGRVITVDPLGNSHSSHHRYPSTGSPRSIPARDRSLCHPLCRRLERCKYRNNSASALRAASGLWAALLAVLGASSQIRKVTLPALAKQDRPSTPRFCTSVAFRPDTDKPKCHETRGGSQRPLTGLADAGARL